MTCKPENLNFVIELGNKNRHLNQELHRDENNTTMHLKWLEFDIRNPPFPR